MAEHGTPTSCPYCGSIENNGRICFWCGNPVTEYESEENTMTIEMKFTGLSPETALKLLKAAAETSAGGTATVSQTDTAPQSTPAPQALPAQPPIAAPAAVNPTVGVPCAAQQPPIAPPVPSAIPQPTAVPPSAVPTAAPTYTLDALARAGAALAQAGKMQDAVNLLAKYGVQSVNQLKPEQYGAFATELRALGAQI